MTDSAIFEQAIHVPKAKRSEYADELCNTNLEQRQRLKAMLEAFENAGSFLEHPVLEETGAFRPALEGPGSSIGPYKLLQQIGEGGFGVVFMAEQQVPVRRKVALKIIKPGMDTKEVIARFESERQALALMDHPNIAKVLDAGATEYGRPYFVMELVKGVSITEYCDKNSLVAVARLELFTLVCRAVQHAHQKGIIHRDIKPSNVMITLHDGKPVPKVIDFGVAKATNQQLTAQTLFTTYGQMIGTPAYMSPEQAEMSGLDVDTRSDIYSLGVLLYELLTGSTPFDSKRLRHAGYAEMQRIICEEAPSKPSTRMTSLGDTATVVSSHRGSDPKRLAALMRGDLDWIVMKALAKERDRRYETSNAFALDIERFLRQEAILARPPSTTYKVRKFVQRNQKTVLAISMMAAALMLGTVLSIWQAVVATRARTEAREHQAKAELERDEKEKLRVAEVEQRLAAQKRMNQIEKGNEILGSIFKDLNPRLEEKEGKPLRVLLGERLVGAVKQLEGEAVGDPVAVAKLQHTLGESLLGLGYPEKAIDLFIKERATLTTHLGPNHSDTLQSMYNLADAYYASGKLDQALPLLEETLQLRKSKLGNDHPDTLFSMHALGRIYWQTWKMDKALPLFEETLKLRKVRLGPDHPDTISSMSALAIGYHNTNKLDQAQQLYEETLKLRRAKLGSDHPNTFADINNLAEVYQDQGRLELTLPLFEEVFNRATAKLGPDHPSTLLYMINLVEAYRNLGKLNLSMSEEAFNRTKAKLGPNHYLTFESMDYLASAYLSAGKLELALPLFEETFKLRRAHLGAEHKHTLYTESHLAVAYQAAGKLDVALPLLEETLKLAKATLGSDASFTLMCIHNLGEGYRASGKFELALPLLLQAAIGIEKQNFAHRFGKQIVGDLVTFYEQLKQYDQAELWRRKWLAVVKERSGEESWAHAVELSELGQNLLRQKKYGNAESALLVAFERMKHHQAQSQKKDAVRFVETIESLIQLYTETHKPDEIKTWQAEKTKLLK